MINLPGLDYNAPVSITDLSWLEEVYTKQFLQRMMIICGGTGIYDTISNWGIVDENNPTVGIGNSISSPKRPLAVQISEDLAYDVRICPGIAVTPSGHVIIIKDYTTLNLADKSSTAVNVIFCEYSIEEDPETLTLNKYLVPTASRYKESDILIKSATLDDWNDGYKFSFERKQNIVVIGLGEYSNSTNPTLSIINSNDVYTYNRHWFSAIDIQHRNEKGTGLDTVPHSIGLNDLSSGNMTLYKQFSNYGLIISKEKAVPGIPGKICKDTFLNSTVKSDTDGSITGITGAKYVVLQNYPVTIVEAKIDDSTFPMDLAVSNIPGTKYIVIDNEDYTKFVSQRSKFFIKYTNVSCLEPSIDVANNQTVNISSPDSGSELFVTNGKALDVVAVNSLSLGNMPEAPYYYDLFIDGDGNPFTNPFQLMKPTYLSTLGSAVKTIDINLIGACKPKIILTSPSVSGDFSMVVKITGKDEELRSVEDTITFNSSNYIVPTVGSKPNKNLNYLSQSYIKGTDNDTLFSSIESIQITSITSYDAQAKISLFAKYEIPVTEDFLNYCKICRVFWDGNKIADLYDCRYIISNLSDSYNNVKNLGNAFPSSVENINTYKCVLNENLKHPKYLDYSKSDMNGLAFHPNGLSGNENDFSYTLTTRPFIGILNDDYSIDKLLIVLNKYDFLDVNPEIKVEEDISSTSVINWSELTSSIISDDKNQRLILVDNNGNNSRKIRITLTGNISSFSVYSIS